MDLSLTESESRYYNDLFTLCDVEKTNKIQNLKALEFFRSANNVDNSVLAQVSLKIAQLDDDHSSGFSLIKAIAMRSTRSETFFREGQHFSFRSPLDLVDRFHQLSL